MVVRCFGGLLTPKDSPPCLIIGELECRISRLCRDGDQGKDPPEGAQNGVVAPAIRRAAAANRTHALDKPADDGEQEIQAGHVTGHPS